MLQVHVCRNKISNGTSVLSVVRILELQKAIGLVRKGRTVVAFTGGRSAGLAP